MPAPGPNRHPISVVELDGGITVYSAEEWHSICARLKGMRLCQRFSVIGERLFKREPVEDEALEEEEEER
jgi:hypothetical protein